MVGRRMHPSGRPQGQRSRERVGEAFAVRRPLARDSVIALVKMVDKLLDTGSIPNTFEMRPQDGMALTYIEKTRMSKELRGFAAGFDARGSVDRVTARSGMEKPITVPLGRVGLMGARNNVLVVHTGHSQVVADEYAHIIDGLEASGIPGTRKRAFRPHISLGSMPDGTRVNVKSDAVAATQLVLPEDVVLDAIMTIPTNPTRRR